MKGLIGNLPLKTTWFSRRCLESWFGLLVSLVDQTSMHNMDAEEFPQLDLEAHSLDIHSSKLSSHLNKTGRNCTQKVALHLPNIEIQGASKLADFVSVYVYFSPFNMFTFQESRPQTMTISLDLLMLRWERTKWTKHILPNGWNLMVMNLTVKSAKSP